MTMPMVEIDPDIYDFLRRSVRDFRETESAVLRRLLNLPVPRGLAAAAPARAAQATLEGGETPLRRFVGEMQSKHFRSATDKFLAILEFVYQQDPKAFEKVLEIGGRRRKYFGRSRQEIVSSGTSTHPRQIPRAPYWVMTNADTRQKCEMLRLGLKTLGYSEEDARAADGAVY